MSLLDTPSLWTHARAAGAATTFLYSTHLFEFANLERFNPPISGGGTHSSPPTSSDEVRGQSQRGADILWRLSDLREKGSDELRGCGDDRVGLEWFADDVRKGRHAEPFVGMYSFTVCHGNFALMFHRTQWKRLRAKQQARQAWIDRDPAAANATIAAAKRDGVQVEWSGPATYPGRPPLALNEDGVVKPSMDVDLEEELWWQDHLIGEMLHELEAAGVLNRTAIVMVGDHGGTPVVAPGNEPLRKPWKQCRSSECSDKCPCPEDAQRDPSTEIGRTSRISSAYAHVPFVLRVPRGYLDAGTAATLRANTAAVVSLYDMVPTLLDLMGRTHPDSAAYVPGRRLPYRTSGESLLLPLQAAASALKPPRGAQASHNDRPVILLNTGMFRAYRFEPFAISWRGLLLLYDDVLTTFHLCDFDKHGQRAFNYLRLGDEGAARSDGGDAALEHDLWPALSADGKLEWLAIAMREAYLRRVVWMRYIASGAAARDGLSVFAVATAGQRVQ